MNKTISNKEILNRLSVLESVFFYKADGSDDPEGVSTADLKAIHKDIRAILENWHSITGATID